MNQILFDTGIQEFEIGAGVLRFNPSDPNVYSRFFEVQERIVTLAEQYESAQENSRTESEEEDEPARRGLKLLREIDREVKKELSYVFGEQNDFDVIFSGINLLGVGTNGKYIITNLFEALLPIIQNGFERQAQARANSVKMNREQRRTLNRRNA